VGTVGVSVGSAEGNEFFFTLPAMPARIRE
jgi:hypothetical protein